MQFFSGRSRQDDIRGCVRAILRDGGFLTVLDVGASQSGASRVSHAQSLSAVAASPKADIRQDIEPAAKMPKHAPIRFSVPMGSVQDRAEKLFLQAATQGIADLDGVLLDLRTPGDTLVISCSGMVPGRAIYAMENTAKDIPTSKLFISDSQSLWYYNGIAHITEDFDDTVQFMRALIARLKPRVTCAIGTSGGGYMALLLAGMLGLDRALAFSPQTVISAAWRTQNRDLRFSDNIDAIYRAISPREPYDVLDLINSGPHTPAGQPTQFHIIYPAGDRLDMAHAMRLEGLPHVQTYKIAGFDHNTSATLKNNGKLGAVLESFIQNANLNLASDLRYLADG